MSYTGFELCIEAPCLQQIARHWQSARGAHGLPRWNDLHIAEGLKPIIWTYDYDHTTERFVGRFGGASIEHLFGKSVAGTAMEDLYPPRDYPRLYERAKRVVATPEAYRGTGMVFRHLDRFGAGERIMLPVAEDEEHGDGILGATVYQFFQIDRSDVVPETDSWFALR